MGSSKESAAMLDKRQSHDKGCMTYFHNKRMYMNVLLLVCLLSLAFYIGSGYFAVDGNLPSETILP